MSAVGLTSAKYLAAAAILAAAGFFIVPQARHAAELYLAGDDPERLAALTLRREINADILNAHMQKALEADDVDLADSLLHLANQQGLTIKAELRDAYAEAKTTLKSLQRDANALWQGAVSGQGQGAYGLGGAFAADLSGIGDVRDLILQGEKFAKGEAVDELVVSLSVVGLALTGLTIASLGSTLPARGGATVLKSAAKGGQLSRPLVKNLGRMGAEAVDITAAKRAAASLRSLDLQAARQSIAAAVRPQALGKLATTLGDVSTIGSKAGVRTMQESVRIAHSSEDLARLSVLATRRGSSLQAILATVGRGAIAVGMSAAVITSWIAAGAGYGLMVLLFVVGLLRLCWRAGRAMFRLGRVRMRQS